MCEQEARNQTGDDPNNCLRGQCKSTFATDFAADQVSDRLRFLTRQACQFSLIGRSGFEFGQDALTFLDFRVDGGDYAHGVRQGFRQGTYLSRTTVGIVLLLTQPQRKEDQPDD
jgi:hypothetical protein